MLNKIKKQILNSLLFAIFSIVFIWVIVYATTTWPSFPSTGPWWAIPKLFTSCPSWQTLQWYTSTWAKVCVDIWGGGVSGGSDIKIFSENWIIPNTCDWTFVGWLCLGKFYKDITFPEPFNKIPHVLVSPEFVSDQGGSVWYATDQVAAYPDNITKNGFRLYANWSPQGWSYDWYASLARVGYIAISNEWWSVWGGVSGGNFDSCVARTNWINNWTNNITMCESDEIATWVACLMETWPQNTYFVDNNKKMITWYSGLGWVIWPVIPRWWWCGWNPWTVAATVTCCKVTDWTTWWSTQWTTNWSNIYYTWWNVGIGVNPWAKLEINTTLGNHIKLSGATQDGGIWATWSKMSFGSWNTASGRLSLDMVTGNVKVTGDICNGDNKCLSQVNNTTWPAIYQCPNDPTSSCTNGLWGFYGCKGQITTSSKCRIIAYPCQEEFDCTYIGSLILGP